MSDPFVGSNLMKGGNMKPERRSFLKKAVVAGSAAAVGAVAANANSNDSSGVVVGKSKKKEILYKKTRAWEMYYHSAL